MENTYQDLITDIQSKNPKISGKLEGGKKFKIVSDFKPAGDQPTAIKKLVDGANKQQLNQVLLGANIKAGLFVDSIIFAIVKVLPDPVTPNKVWWSKPSWRPDTKLLIAVGWDPAGSKSDTTFNAFVIYLCIKN